MYSKSSQVRKEKNFSKQEKYEFVLPFLDGHLKAIFTEQGLLSLSYRSGKINASQPAVPENIRMQFLQFAKQLKKYEMGDLHSFSTWTQLEQGTPFQLSVWKAMRRIPYGKTLTYADIAKQIGRPKAVRAVGGACNRNPLILLTPCHRVVARNGIGGFAAGTKLKLRLLELEKNHL